MKEGVLVNARAAYAGMTFLVIDLEVASAEFIASPVSNFTVIRLGRLGCTELSAANLRPVDCNTTLRGSSTWIDTLL